MAESRDISRSDGRAAWSRIARSDSAAPAVPVAWAARLAEFTGAALADHLLGPGAGLEPRAVEQSRLFNRFTRGGQEACLQTLGEAGLQVVALKGFASAHTLYPDPDLRVTGDLDVLVRRSDRDRLLEVLAAVGYAFAAFPRKPWGFISTASYLPFVAQDRSVNLDVHVEPDCYPLYRSLTSEHLFAAATPLREAKAPVLAPSTAHSFLLLASNAAKDKYGPFAVKKVIDALVVLRQHPDLDWDEISGLARSGGFLKPLRVFLALLAELGASLRGVPDELCRSPTGLAGREFRRVLCDWLLLFPGPPAGGLARLRREALLGAEGPVLLANNWMRLKGCLLPGSGLPPGWTARPPNRQPGRETSV